MEKLCKDRTENSGLEIGLIKEISLLTINRTAFFF